MTGENKMDIEQIMRLIDKVSESSVTEVAVEEGSLKIKIKKNEAVVQTVYSEGSAPAQVVSVPTVQPTQTAPAQEVKSATVDEKVIDAPIVGVFYAASNPDADPYIQVGDTVKKGQIVGIIEAMKLMNEIESDVEGVVTEVLVENGTPVEYGQPLFRVK